MSFCTSDFLETLLFILIQLPVQVPSMSTSVRTILIFEWGLPASEVAAYIAQASTDYEEGLVLPVAFVFTSHALYPLDDPRSLATTPGKGLLNPVELLASSLLLLRGSAFTNSARETYATDRVRILIVATGASHQSNPSVDPARYYADKCWRNNVEVQVLVVASPDRSLRCVSAWSKLTSVVRQPRTDVAFCRYLGGHCGVKPHGVGA